MIPHYGEFTTSDTVYVFFNTFSSDDPSASVTITGLAVTDIEIYKNGSVTQRSSDNGYTLLDTDGIDFDGITGVHGFSIDLSDDTDSGFYASNSHYLVVVSAITVDGATISFAAAQFHISKTGGLATVIADTEAILADSEAILTDSEAILADTEAAVPVLADTEATLADTEAAITERTTLLTDTEAILADSEAILTDSEAILADTESINASAIADAVWDENIIAAHETADTAGRIISDNVNAQISVVVTDTEAILADSEAIITDSEAILADTEAAITERSTLLADTEATLADTEAAITERTTILTDTEAVLADSEAIITDSEAILADVEAILVDTSTTLPDQIGAIGAGSGASLSVEAATDNVLGGITGVTSGTTFVGVQSTNTFAVTAFDDATYHVIDDTTNAIDIVYQFLIGGGASPQSITFNGYVDSSNDTMTVSAWDHVGGAWEAISTIAGQNGTVDITKTITLLSRHAGTSAAELGKVYVRLHCTGQSNPQLNLDQLLVNYAITSQSVGYSGGFVYIDTNNGVAGTVDFTNGTADNPVDSLADALTIASSLNLTKFHIAAGSSITLAADFESKLMDGFLYDLNFGSQSIAGSYIKGADIQASTATGEDYILDDCRFQGNVTMAPGVVRHSYFGTFTITAGSAGDFFWNGLTDRATGLNSPTFDYGTSIGNTNLNVHNYAGALTVTNMGDTGNDTLVMSGRGRFIEGASNTGGTVTLIGSITESGITNLTVTNQHFDRVNTEADTAITDAALATLADSEAILTDVESAITERATLLTDTEAILADSEAIISDTELILTDSEAILTDAEATLADTEAATAVLTDTEAILADSELILTDAEAILADSEAIVAVTNALGVSAATKLSLSANQIIVGTVDTATNGHTPTVTEFQADDITEATGDHFNGRIIIFTSGVLAGQATDITDYEQVGGIGQFTVTAMTEAAANNDTFIIL